MNYFLTIIIPVFNRRDSVVRAISSAFDCFEFCHSRVQVIVIDDKSTDDTVKIIKDNFSEKLKSEEVILVESETNLGVCGARNLGIKFAKGKWLLFLDSDDQLLQNCGSAVVNELENAEKCPVVFFRCINHLGRLVGTNHTHNGCLIDLKNYLLHGSYGEVLVVIQREKADEKPFLENLRGYEGLTVARIINAHGPSYLSPVVARIYNQNGNDRLSSGVNFIARMPLLAKGHLIMIREFWGAMKLSKSLGYLVKAIIYFILGNAYRLFKKVA